MTPAGTNLLLAHADAAPAPSDVVTKSLRFNDGDSPVLTRTPSSSGSQTTFTLSLWVKRSNLNSTGYKTFWASEASGSNYVLLTFYQDGLSFLSYSPVYQSISNAKYTDVSAWYHIVLSVDTTQATDTDRVKIYVNGSAITFSSSTYPVLNYGLQVNTSSYTNKIGYSAGTAQYFDGYLADAYFIDGTALTPTSFAEEDATTGQWKPKAYSGSYGTNGFHLDFEEDSATSGSNAGIGKDVSGNGNYFNTTNLAASDVVLDNPSPGSNFCTLNPLDISRGTLSEGSLKYTGITSTWGDVLSTFAASTGKWYWEVTATGVSEAEAFIAGILQVSKADSGSYWYDSGWDNASMGYCYGVQDNNRKVTGGSQGSFTSGITDGSVIGFHLDLDSSTTTIAISVDGVDKGDGAGGAGYLYSSLAAAEYSPALNLYGPSVADVNFGQGDPNGNNNYQDGNGKGNFKYEPDSGFLAWCTNTQTATIAKGVTYFDVLTYDDGAGAKTFDNGTVSMQPDLVWVKSRGSAYDHKLTDSVRGVTKALESNTTDTEATDLTGLTAFGSDGFTVGSDSNYSDTTGDGMVAWCWKESSSAGFDIITWTGNASMGSAQSVSHSLGVTPELIIAKPRESQMPYDDGWPVWHKDLTSGEFLVLDDTDAETAWDTGIGTSALFTVSGTSSVSFGVGSTTFGAANQSLNQGAFGPMSAINYVAYLFASVAGYSRVGSFTGSSSAFIYCGFRPAFILAKRYDSAGSNWLMFDDKRDGYNVDNDDLEANDTAIEATTDHIDILSNGFKIRTSDADLNAGTVIYYAVAKNPFKYANAR